VVALVVLWSEGLEPEQIGRQLERHLEVIRDEGGGHDRTRYDARSSSRRPVLER
jgi:hypothetical protein